MSVLLEKFDTKFLTVPFSKIKNEDFVPALKQAILSAKKNIDLIKQDKNKASFENVCEALERTDREINLISNTFFNLHSANTTDSLQLIAKEISPILAEYGNDVAMDGELFAKIREVYDDRINLHLNTEQERLLEKQYKALARNGALLNAEEKMLLREIDKKLSKLTLEFGDHVLNEKNKFELIIDDKNDLRGLPDSSVEAAVQAAKEKGRDGKWLFSLDYPSYGPFLTYADNRDLREKMFRAYNSVGLKDNEFDNKSIILEITKLRCDRAKLLGHATHSNYVLEERMAETPERVMQFLDELLQKSRPHALKEVKELEKFSQSIGGPEKLERWDTNYYAEKLRKEKFDVDDELLRPYFKLENVINGGFEVANRLYGITFEHDSEIETYHPDVLAYVVRGERGELVGIFYADFFPRKGKRGGAWMTEFRAQSKYQGVDQRPHVSIVCNFTKPTDTRPSLLTHDEVLTFFHEFGHALHGLLSDVHYESLAGPSVYWDFVELPSQVMENWVYEKECLDLFATHYKTGEKMPLEIINKVRNARTFLEGRMTIRQLCLGLLDMAWHGQETAQIKDVEKFERELINKVDVQPVLPGTCISTAFSHIFNGGYSSGYYSYKWAEVLDADAFEYFKEHGIFNKDVAQKFRQQILSKGGTDHPMNLYKKFRGQEPNIDPLLRRSGLI